MFTFITDGPIICERCHGFFCSYGVMHSFVDADSLDTAVKEAYDGNLNKVTCPACGDSFTYESPLLIYSQNNKFAICSDFSDECLQNGSFNTIVSIGSMEDWKFRRCSFSMFGFEKLRIFKNNMDDTIIEQIKISHFPAYCKMEFDSEYIVYEKHNDKTLFFTHRDFTGKIIQTLSVPMSEYQNYNSFSAVGRWQQANREEVIKHMEVTK